MTTDKPKRELVSGAKVKGIIPTSMEDAFRLATAVIASGMAPPDVKTQEAALVIILTGMEVGLPPMAALQRIALINGRTTIWGDAAIGLVRASGLLAGFKEWKTPDGVWHCKVKRKGETNWHEGKFGVEDAKKAGLWDRKNRDGSPGMYAKYPDRMCQMRARGFPLRDTFADVLGGMYLREELEGIEPEMTDITPPAAPQPTVDIIPPKAPEPKMRPKPAASRSRQAYAAKTEMPAPLVPPPEEGFDPDDESEALGRQITETAQMDAEDGDG